MTREVVFLAGSSNVAAKTRSVFPKKGLWFFQLRQTKEGEQTNESKNKSRRGKEIIALEELWGAEPEMFGKRLG
jgi:hypothetical protein